MGGSRDLVRLASSSSHLTPLRLRFYSTSTSLDSLPGGYTAVYRWQVELPANKSGSRMCDVPDRRALKILIDTYWSREVLIGILGLCGVLETSEHRGYMTRFVPWSERELPARRFIDMHYPACWWTRADGVNGEAVQYWFGHVL